MPKQSVNIVSFANAVSTYSYHGRLSTFYFHRIQIEVDYFSPTIVSMSARR